MDQKAIQKAFNQALKNELVPLLIGIRSDIADQMKSFEENGGGFKFHLSKEMFDQITVRDGKTPVKGIDYFTDDEVATLIRLATPRKGKDYFTSKDIKDIVKLCIPKKGKDYKDGITPKKGKDYFTDSEIKEFMELIRPIKGIHYKDGEPGNPGKPGTPASAITGSQIVDKLVNLSKTEQLPINAIRGLREALDTLINLINQSGSSLGGSGAVTIDNGGSAGASGARFQAPAETPDGTNTVFTFPGIANKPNAIVVNQLWYFETDGWTWNAGASQATILFVPVANSTIRASY